MQNNLEVNLEVIVHPGSKRSKQPKPYQHSYNLSCLIRNILIKIQTSSSPAFSGSRVVLMTLYNNFRDFSKTVGWIQTNFFACASHIFQWNRMFLSLSLLLQPFELSEMLLLGHRGPRGLQKEGRITRHYLSPSVSGKVSLDPNKYIKCFEYVKSTT